MNRPLGVAIVGCGRVAGHHAHSIAAVEGITLMAVCDLAEDKAAAYSRDFDVPYFDNYHVMLRAVPNIDVVAIITPSGMHFEHVMEIMAYHGKHVIVEKPTFMRPDQVNAAYAAADRLGLHIFPVFQNRHNKAVTRVRHALDKGELGDVRLINVRVRWCRPQRYYDLAPWRGTFSHDGGALTNQGIHHVDLLRYLGGPIARVSAVMRTLGAQIEAEDTIVAAFVYDSGAVGSLEVTTAARPDDFEASLSIVGARGLAQVGGIAVNELQIFTPNPAECAKHSEDFIGIKGHGAVYGYGHTQMYRDIVADLGSNIPYPVGREDCLGTLALLHAFYRADEIGGWTDVDWKQLSTRLGRNNEAVSTLYRTPKP